MNSCEIDRTSDAVVINDINPFVVGRDAMNLPGAWSGAYDFSYYNNKRVKADDAPVKEISPTCKFAGTAGYRTIDTCKPSPPNCPMTIITERDINRDIWYNTPTHKLKSDKKLSCPLVYALFALLVILLILKI